MSYTMKDFIRDYHREHFLKLPPEEREKVLQSIPLEERLAGLSAEQIQQYLDRLTADRSAKPSKPRRKQ